MTPALSQGTLLALADIAERAALSAGRIISERRRTDVAPRHKSVGDSEASQIVTDVDHLAQDAILALLEPTRATYDLALLTEESTDDGSRLHKPAFWCIDPLDGTRAFVTDTPGFSVSIALIARDATPLIGIVYDPVAGVTYRAVRNHGAYRDQRRMQLPALDPRQPLSLRTDFSFQGDHRLPATLSGLEQLAHRLGLPGSVIEYRTGGVINACGVLENANYCYFKYPRSGDSGGSLWDYAATACLFDEVGACASDIRRERMDLNREDSTFMNHRGLLFAANDRVAQGIAELAANLVDT